MEGREEEIKTEIKIMMQQPKNVHRQFSWRVSSFTESAPASGALLVKTGQILKLHIILGILPKVTAVILPVFCKDESYLIYMELLAQEDILILLENRV